MLRWSKQSGRHTVRSFLAKRNAEEPRPDCHATEFMYWHSSHAISNLHRWLPAQSGWRIGIFLIDRIERGLAAIARCRFAGLGRTIESRVVHAGSAGLQRRAKAGTERVFGLAG